MNKQFAVIGLGDFGRSIAISLAEKGADVIAIDENMDIVEDIKDKVTYAVRLDSTDEDGLKALGLNKMDTVIVSMGDHFEDEVLTSVLLLQQGAKKVIARANSPIQEKILHKLGVHQVISPEFEMARRLAQTLFNENYLDYTPLGDDYIIAQIKTPQVFIGKTLQEIDLRKRYYLNLITIKRSQISHNNITGEETIKEKIIGVPTAGTILEANDVLILLGTERHIEELALKDR